MLRLRGPKLGFREHLELGLGSPGLGLRGPGMVFEDPGLVAGLWAWFRVAPGLISEAPGLVSALSRSWSQGPPE